jgi:hypothetical protein
MSIGSQGNLETAFRSLVSSGTASTHGNVHGDLEQRLVGTELFLFDKHEP